MKYYILTKSLILYRTMCQQCKNLIYDIIISPLSLSHPLHSYIKFKSLRRCALEVSDCFYRAVKEFPIYSEIFRVDINDTKEYTEFDCDEIIWNRFHETYQSSHELEYAIDLCIDYSVGKNTTGCQVPNVLSDIITKEQLIKQFLMDRLRKILVLVPSSHRDHTLKLGTDDNVSIGPVCKWKIIAIRKLAGLPITNYLPKNVYTF